jgi:hypothetical protein
VSRRFGARVVGLCEYWRAPARNDEPERARI